MAFYGTGAAEYLKSKLPKILFPLARVPNGHYWKSTGLSALIGEQLLKEWELPTTGCINLLS
jgi:hypothetical protein